MSEAPRPRSASPRLSPPAQETRRDVEAAYAARLELGPQFEGAIAEGLAERVEQLVAYRTAELRQESRQTEDQVLVESRFRTQRFVLGIVSVGAGIPITAISGQVAEPGLLGTAIAWAGIVGVNAVHALSGRPRR
jgi:hypothetical protein